MPHYLVTGASSGIGAALVAALLRRGDKVTALARREDRLAALDDGSGNFHATACDVTDAAALAGAIQTATDRLGAVDCAILNAGMYVPQDTARIDPAVYARHMDVNYMGVVNALPPADRRNGCSAQRPDRHCLFGGRMARPAESGSLWPDQGGVDLACRIPDLRPRTARY